MLVLSRLVDEKILAGDVVITVVAIRGDKVRIGIEAPDHVSVHREEVAVAIAEDGDAHEIRTRLRTDRKRARIGTGQAVQRPAPAHS